MKPPDIDLTSPFAHVYWNNHLMTEIVGNVERFEDRDALELSSTRLREIALKTPISRRQGYKVFMEYEPETSQHLSRFKLLHKRNRSKRIFKIQPCYDPPVEENDLRIESLDSRDQCCVEEDFFFTRIQKRMPKSIVEFELKNGLISHELLSHLEKLSNLKRFVFRYAGKRELSREWEPLWEFELPDPQFVATRVESLALILDRENSDEITNLKCMIGPGLKHFGVHVAPRCYQWFVEEVMVELGVHNVQLDTCQLVFANPRMPIHLITSMVHSISERTQVMHVVCMEKANVQLTHYLKPAIIIEFNGKNEKLLKALQEKCPQIFQKAEILEVYNLSEEGFGYLVSALEKCYSLRELTISCDPKKFHRFLIDPALKVLPYSIQHLTLTYCYFSAVSIVYLTAQLAKSLQSLVLKQNSNFYNEKNFSELLRGMTELRNFEIDMRISPLSFPKIAAHRNLERFVAIPEGKPTEKALQVLRFKFQNVTIHETERRRFVLDVSNRRPVKLTDKR